MSALNPGAWCSVLTILDVWREVFRLPAVSTTDNVDLLLLHGVWCPSVDCMAAPCRPVCTNVCCSMLRLEMQANRQLNEVCPSKDLLRDFENLMVCLQLYYGHTHSALPQPTSSVRETGGSGTGPGSPQFSCGQQTMKNSSVKNPVALISFY